MFAQRAGPPIYGGPVTTTLHVVVFVVERAPDVYILFYIPFEFELIVGRAQFVGAFGVVVVEGKRRTRSCGASR
jgi:hypothetical protein